MAETLIPPKKFDSSNSVTGLDFIARSLVTMEANGTPLCPEAMTGNMTDEQKAIFMARLNFHRNRRDKGKPSVRDVE